MQMSLLLLSMPCRMDAARAENIDLQICFSVEPAAVYSTFVAYCMAARLTTATYFSDTFLFSMALLY